jgi:RNAse (barnase) inhibitor barstar
MRILKNGILTPGELNIQENDFVANLSPALKKAELFSELKEKLSFPSYFGNNWDALVDMMRDLEWLPKKVVLIHEGTLSLTEKDFQIYLDILSDAISTLSERDGTQLVVAFPD